MVDTPMDATVIFLFLSGEEHGLLGAAAMAEKHWKKIGMSLPLSITI